MKVYEEQTDFSGGANDYLSPERLPINSYAFAQNMEIRDGSAQVRRGQTDLADRTSFAGQLLQGVGIYRTTFEDGDAETIVQARSGKLYYWMPPGVITEMTLPAGKTLGTGKCGFFRFLDHLYLYRSSSDEVWKWDGNASHAWTVVTAPVETETAGEKIPNTSFAVEAYGRIWAITAQNELQCSDLLSESFDSVNMSWIVGAGSGDQLMAAAPMAGGYLVLLKERSIHVASGCNGDVANMAVQILDQVNGCIGKNAWCQVGNDVWFFSRDGVRTVSLTAQNFAQMLDVPLSRPISGIIATINPLYMNKIRALVHDNYVIFAIPTNSATGNCSVIAFDLLLKAWVGIWTGIEAVEMIRAFSWSKERAVCFRSDGSPYHFLSDEELDGNAYIVTRGFSCGDPQRKKRFSTGLVTIKSKDCAIDVFSSSLTDDETTPKLSTEIQNSVDGLLFLPSEGLTIPDAGIYLDKFVVELREFWSGQISPWTQLTIQCTAGSMALKTIRLSADPSGKTVSEE